MSETIIQSATRLKARWEPENMVVTQADQIDDRLFDGTAGGEEVPRIMRPGVRLLYKHSKRFNALVESLETAKNLASTAWWSRVWIIQEICLARETTVVCGDTELDLDLLLLGLVCLFTLGQERIQRSRLPPSWTILRLMQLRDVGQQNRKDLSLFNLLQQFRVADATKPRDRVYALLRLLPEATTAAVDRAG